MMTIRCSDLGSSARQCLMLPGLATTVNHLIRTLNRNVSTHLLPQYHDKDVANTQGKQLDPEVKRHARRFWKAFLLRTAQSDWASHQTTMYLHCTAQHGTARHSTAQHGTARHGTARHGTARHLSTIEVCFAKLFC